MNVPDVVCGRDKSAWNLHRQSWHSCHVSRQTDAACNDRVSQSHLSIVCCAPNTLQQCVKTILKVRLSLSYQYLVVNQEFNISSKKEEVVVFLRRARVNHISRSSAQTNTLTQCVNKCMKVPSIVELATSCRKSRVQYFIQRVVIPKRFVVLLKRA